MTISRFEKYNTRWARERRQNNREEHILKSCRNIAKRKELAFNLELEDVIIPEECPVLKLPLFFTESKRTDNTPSIDRIENTEGYVKGNVLISSWRFNRLKSDASLEELVLLGQWAQHQISTRRVGLSQVLGN